MKKSKVSLSPLDYQILEFLWRWKLATTRMIEMKFYPESKGLAAYFRLWRLARAGIVAAKSDADYRHNYWVLTTAGFAAVKSELPPLIEEGFKSENLKHDFLVAAAHLGNWLVAKPDGVQLFSEQELRRVDPKSYPRWVPNSQIHRPDGYWHVSAGEKSKTLALELELSQKSLENYESVAQFYLEDTNVDQIIWIVKKPSFASSIHKRITDTISGRTNRHSFILLDDFLHSIWQSKVLIGKDAGNTMESILAKVLQDPRKGPCNLEILDTRKYQIKSAPKQNLETLKFVN